MANQPNYPGVYVDEVTIGVRTIVEVSTSIVAFIGRARRGPVNAPTRVFNFADFVQRFGEPWEESTLAGAVEQFFLHGGEQAVIVRVFAGDPDASTPTIELSTSGTPLVLQARSPGSWGGLLRATVEHRSGQEEGQSFFDLTVRELDRQGGEIKDAVRTESFERVSADPAHERFVAKVLEAGSALVRVRSAPTGQVPNAGSVDAVAPTDADGDPIGDAQIADPDNAAKQAGLWALDCFDQFNLLCIPPLKPGGSPHGDPKGSTWSTAAKYCQDRRAILIVDPPSNWTVDSAKAGVQDLRKNHVGPDLCINAAAYFPRLRISGAESASGMADLAPCGAIAGIIARTDRERGVWKAPAGLGAALNANLELGYVLNEAQNGELNPQGLNCLRSFPAGLVVWGARTLAGVDQHAGDWTYLPVRRLALHIEESIYRGTQWVVFEPNDESLWAQVRLSVGAFMQSLFGDGAFQGTTANEAYFVKCDQETTTQADISAGVMNVLVGFAPLKPAEFVLLEIQQRIGTNQPGPTN